MMSKRFKKLPKDTKNLKSRILKITIRLKKIAQQNLMNQLI